MAGQPTRDIQPVDRPQAGRRERGKEVRGGGRELHRTDDDVEEQEQGERARSSAGQMDEQEHRRIVGENFADHHPALEARIGGERRRPVGIDPGEDRVVGQAGGGDEQDRCRRELETERRADPDARDHDRCHRPAQPDLPEAAPTPQLRQSTQGIGECRTAAGSGVGGHGSALRSGASVR